jgi:hypothetical protein
VDKQKKERKRKKKKERRIAAPEGNLDKDKDFST